MPVAFKEHLQTQLAGIRNGGTYKNERVIVTPQGTTIRVADGKPVLNFCANASSVIVCPTYSSASGSFGPANPSVTSIL